jgi:hypothetical protein
VMGSAVLSLILAIPVFILAKLMVVKYRQTVVARFRETKIWKAWHATKIYQWYSKYQQLY